MKYEVGNHNIRKKFNCLKCATDFYYSLNGKAYLKDTETNKIILNTYGW